MNAEEKMKVVEVYHDNFKMLFEIVEKAGEIRYRNSAMLLFNFFLDNVIECAKEAIAELAKDFAENEMLDEGNQQGKLGYAFTWLRKLKSAATDDETEKILKEWLAEKKD